MRYGSLTFFFVFKKHIYSKEKRIEHLPRSTTAGVSISLLDLGGFHFFEFFTMKDFGIFFLQSFCFILKKVRSQPLTNLQTKLSDLEAYSFECLLRHHLLAKSGINDKPLLQEPYTAAHDLFASGMVNPRGKMNKVGKQRIKSTCNQVSPARYGNNG